MAMRGTPNGIKHNEAVRAPRTVPISNGIIEGRAVFRGHRKACQKLLAVELGPEIEARCRPFLDGVGDRDAHLRIAGPECAERGFDFFRSGAADIGVRPGGNRSENTHQAENEAKHGRKILRENPPGSPS